LRSVACTVKRGKVYENEKREFTEIHVGLSPFDTQWHIHTYTHTQ